MATTRSTTTIIAAIVAVGAIVALVVGALVLRYGGPSGTTLAVEACIDQASPASTFVVDESFSVDEVLAGERAGLEGWRGVATKIESQYSVDDNVESFWVIGRLDDTTDAVCIVDYTDGELVAEPQFVDVAAFASFQ